MTYMNVKDWYWFVGGDETKVYSSARNVYVPLADADFQAWQISSGMLTPPNALDESDIWHYVSAFQPAWIYDTENKICSVVAPGVYNTNQLHNYNMFVRDQRYNGSMVANGVPVALTSFTRQAAADARGVARGNPSYTCKWLGTDGNFYPLDANGVIAMADAISNQGTECYNVCGTVDAGIHGGTVTTTGEIDVAYTGL